MTSLEEAWGRPGAAAMRQQQGNGRMIGQTYFSGQNRNIDPSMPYVGDPAYSQQQGGGGGGPPPQQMQAPPQQMMQQVPMEYQPPNISVNVEKSEEEKELFRYLRNRLGEDWDQVNRYFREKCKRKIRRSGGACGCVGVSEHVQQCGNCRSMCHQKSEFRANLTLYLLIGVFILLALNLLFPRGFGSSSATKKTA